MLKYYFNIGINIPSLSIVSLILLAAFSLRRPGWLLFMENKVMTPEKKRERRGLSQCVCSWEPEEQALSVF